MLRPLLALLLLLGLSSVAFGTWSIVLVDTTTGEVGLASATCINGGKLKRNTGVVVVGLGAGAIQADGDSVTLWRKAIFQGLQDGLSAQEIYDLTLPDDPAPSSRQMGIVSVDSSVTHTGLGTIGWAGGVQGEMPVHRGQVGSVHYAIQGNIMSCAAVVNGMEETLLMQRGDMAHVLMELMWVARSKGGDWRCSCQVASTEAPRGDHASSDEQQAQNGCGCPPKNMLRASSTAYMVVARIGDVDGVCTFMKGCANGEYYLDLEAKEWDPWGSVPFLAEELRDHRRLWRGHADHLLSKKTIVGGPLPANERASATLEITLVDIDGAPLRHGGAAVTVEHDETSAGVTAIGAVTDHGDGTYSLELTAGDSVGTDVFRIVADDGLGPVTLYPFPRLESVSAALTLVQGPSSDRASSTTLLLDGGAGLAGERYVLVAESGVLPPAPLVAGVFDKEGRATEALPFAFSAAQDRSASATLRWWALDAAGSVSNPITVRPVR